MVCNGFENGAGFYSGTGLNLFISGWNELITTAGIFFCV
jgi:hypothetical protein